MYVTPMATLYFGSKVEKAVRDLRFISFSYSKKAVFGEGLDLPESSKKIKSHNFCTYYMLKICKWTNIDTLCLLNMTKSIYVLVKCSYLIFCLYNITLHNYSPCPVSRDHCGLTFSVPPALLKTWTLSGVKANLEGQRQVNFVPTKHF